MESNGVQPSQPTQPGMDVQPPQQPAASSQNPGWPSSAPPPITGVGAAQGSPDTSAPGMASAPASWGAPAQPAVAPSVPVSAPAPAPADPGALASAPVAPPSDSATTPITPGASDQPAHSDDAAHKDDHQNPMAIPGHVAGKRKAPVGIIIVAIIIAVLLAGVAVFAYMKTQKKSTGSVPAKAPVISASDVNSTEKQLDESLGGVSDDTDFAASNLSDASLGL